MGTSAHWRCVCWGPPLPRRRCPPARRRLRGWPASGRRERGAACADSQTGAAWKTDGGMHLERWWRTAPKDPTKEVKLFNDVSLNSLDFLQVVVGVLVGHVRGADVQLEVGSKVLKVVVVRKFWRVETIF